MNKEKILQLISIAMDKGAEISIHVPQFNPNQNWEKVSKGEATELISAFNEELEAEVEHNINVEAGCEGLTIDNRKIRVHASYIPFMIEDVDLTGDENVVI